MFNVYPGWCAIFFFPTKALKTIKEHKAIKAYFRWKWPRITASRPFLILSNSQSLLGWELLILTFTLHLWREIKYGFFMSRHLTRFSLEMCPGGDGSPKWPIAIGITMCSDNRKIRSGQRIWFYLDLIIMTS